MIRKYRVASAAMFCNRLGIPGLIAPISRLERAARKMISENAIESDLAHPPAFVVRWGKDGDALSFWIFFKNTHRKVGKDWSTR